MKSLFFLAAATAFFVPAASVVQAAEERMLVHDVYFRLKDSSPKAREALIAACQKYLADHPGTVWFAAGPRAEEFQRDVNKRDFDVALHVVFKDKASHDQYQKAPKHLKFIAENKANWENVQVFDSWVAAFAHGTAEAMPGKAKSCCQHEKK